MDSELPPLRGPQNDVGRMEAVLASPAAGFDVESFLDIDSYALTVRLEKAFSDARRDDFVLLYYSGHGKLDAKGQLCLATRNTSTSALRATSIQTTLLRDMIGDSQARRIVLLLDCCFSGAASKAFLRGDIDTQLQEGLARGTGIYLLTSSTGIETSRERESDEGGEIMGVFTRCIVEGVETGRADADGDGVITMDDLHQYVETRIRGQRPKYWNFDASGSIEIARAPGSPSVQRSQPPSDAPPARRLFARRAVFPAAGAVSPALAMGLATLPTWIGQESPERAGYQLLFLALLALLGATLAPLVRPRLPGSLTERPGLFVAGLSIGITIDAVLWLLWSPSRG